MDLCDTGIDECVRAVHDHHHLVVGGSIVGECRGAECELSGQTFTNVTTDGTLPNSGPGVKTWKDLRISITPQDDTTA